MIIVECGMTHIFAFCRVGIRIQSSQTEAKNLYSARVCIYMIYYMCVTVNTTLYLSSIKNGSIFSLASFHMAVILSHASSLAVITACSLFCVIMRLTFL